jgi:pyridoxal/pyridoxine/pyridoxamine kinase
MVILSIQLHVSVGHVGNVTEVFDPAPDGLYVADDIVRFYKQQGASSADILKPNAI